MSAPVSAKKESPNILGIVGMTGGGKTTLAQEMAGVLGAEFHDELSPADNPAFERFYELLSSGVKPNPAALEEQLEFLNFALGQSQDIKNNAESNQVMWVMPPVGHFMYAYLLHEGGHLTTDEFVDYCQYFVEQVSQVISPNALIVVLNNQAEVLQARLQARADQESIRQNETKVDVGYWDDQHTYWDQRLAAGQNYPLTELKQILPDEIFTRFAELTAIPMIALYSDQIDWTNSEGAAQVSKHELVSGVLHQN